MTTLLRWLGHDQTKSIESLFDKLKTETLDPMFEQYNAFGGELTASFYAALDVPALKLREARHFWGNFYTFSYSFDVITDDPELIDRLLAAFAENRATLAYKEARDVRKQQRIDRIEHDRIQRERLYGRSR